MSIFIVANASGWLLAGTNTPGTLSVAGNEGYSVSGQEGDTIAGQVVYTLTNTGTTSLNWTATESASWISLSSASGTLAAGASTTVTVTVNASALLEGAYTHDVAFANTTNGNGDTTRTISATVTVAADPGDIPTASSITQHGITWEFSEALPCAQNAIGDWFVERNASGVISFVDITRPHGTADLDGSMLDPVQATYHGYGKRSSGANSYSSAYNVALNVPTTPYTITANDATIKSLCSTISWATGDTGMPSYAAHGWCRSAAILTIVPSGWISTHSTDGVVDYFRPPLCGTTKPLHLVADADISWLPNLATVSGATTLAAQEALVDGVFLRHITDYTSQHIGPSDHMGDPYGRTIMNRRSTALLHCCLNLGSRTTLSRLLVQQGIDAYAEITEAGAKHQNNGGHGNGGGKEVILFAGKCLNDADMLDIGADYASTTNTFGYDAQTFVIQAADVSRLLDAEVSITVTGTTANTVTGTLDRVLAEDAYPTGNECVADTGSQRRTISGYSPSVGSASLSAGASLTLTVSSAWDTEPTVGSSVQIMGYEAGDIGTAEWGIAHSSNPERDNPTLNANYRGNQNSQSYPGLVLAMRIMDLQTEWAHDPLFDYTTRYLSEWTGTKFFVSFHESMWNAYAGSYP